MSWALKSERVGKVRKLAGSEFQTVGAMKLKERSPNLRLRLGIFKNFSFHMKAALSCERQKHFVLLSHNSAFKLKMVGQ